MRKVGLFITIMLCFKMIDAQQITDKTQIITSLEQFKSIDGIHTLGVTKVVPPGFIPGDFTGTSLIIDATSTKRSTGNSCTKKKSGCLCVTIEVNMDGSNLRVISPIINNQSCDAQDKTLVPAGSMLIYNPFTDELSYIPIN